MTPWLKCPDCGNTKNLIFEFRVPALLVENNRAGFGFRVRNFVDMTIEPDWHATCQKCGLIGTIGGFSKHE